MRICVVIPKHASTFKYWISVPNVTGLLLLSKHASAFGTIRDERWTDRPHDGHLAFKYRISFTIRKLWYRNIFFRAQLFCCNKQILWYQTPLREPTKIARARDDVGRTRELLDARQCSKRVAIHSRTQGIGKDEILQRL